MACAETSNASSSVQSHKDPASINVMFVCDEWKSSKGGLSTFNREFAINLAKTTTDSMKIHCYVSKSDELDRQDAKQQGVNLITARSVPGSAHSLDCLKLPPEELSHPDVVTGHGRKFGTPAYFIVRATKCKWVQFAHVFCEDLGKYKETEKEENEKKHKEEIALCREADVVMAVGSYLQELYSRSLPDVKVEVITPGILEKFVSESQLATDKPVLQTFKVFMFGRATFEDRSLKGYDIVANAIGCLEKRFQLTFVGSSPGEHRKIEEWFLKKTRVSREQLTIRGYCSEQNELKMMFHQSDLVALPSRTEGFGLVALEAISAGIPVLVAGKTGIAKALKKVEGGRIVIVKSNDPAKWAQRIKWLSNQSPEKRQTNALQLRENYRQVYSWQTECEKFIRIIQNAMKCPNVQSLKTKVVVETMKTAECNTLNRPPTKESVDCQESQHQDPSEVPTVPYLLQDLKSNDITPQKVLASIAWNYLLQTPPKSREDHDHFLTHMAKMGGIIKGIEKGSLLIKVRCVSQQILEELWEDYLSGHLGEVVQRCFVTDEILKELNLAELKLKTTIQEEEYKACKECFEKDNITDLLTVGETATNRQHFAEEAFLTAGETNTPVESGHDLMAASESELKLEVKPKKASGHSLDPLHPSSPFYLLLMSISDQLTDSDLEKMKRCLQLPEINLEDVQTASDLFCQMMNAELLSADNLKSLASVLKSAGLLDLCNEVILNASKLKSSTKGPLTIREISTHKQHCAEEPMTVEETDNSTKIGQVPLCTLLKGQLRLCEIATCQNSQHGAEEPMTVGKTNTNVETGHDQSEPELGAKPEPTLLGGEDLEKMKFCLQLPEGKLEDIQRPFEVFRRMINVQSLSADNPGRLASLLESAGRIDLSKELLQYVCKLKSANEEESLSDGRQCYASALPCKPAQFCGRDERLDEIVRVLSETNGRRLVVITGSPGCGKSFLAKKIGLAMLEKHFQVIFLCLREIRSVAKMAARILLSLKTYAWQGLVNNQRPELALSRLKLLTTRTVLILDNAEYLINDSNESKMLFKFVNQVVQFASNVKCVVTSRVDYPSDCCQTPHHSVKLTAPENVAASKLLQEKVKENSGFTLEDAEANAIAGFCFNIPLTLHKVAAYLEVVPTQTLIQILEKDQSPPLDVMDVDELSPDLKVKCFLHDCLQQLGSELEEALVSLAVFPGAFDYQQAMDVFGSKRLHANLVQLEKRSLVHSCLNSNQYFVHRVIQLCCEEKAKTDERVRTCYKKARQRFIEHYLNLIRDLHRRFLCKGGLNKTLCHYWMEEQHILQAIWWAVTSGDTTLSTSCTEILNEAVIFLAKVMKKDEFEHVYEVVLNDIKGDLRLVADCLTCVGIKQVYSCEFHRVCSTVSKRGYRVLQRALEIYEELNLTDGELVAQCYSKIGRCMAKNGNPTRAFELIEKALEIWEKKREEEPLKYAACCNDRADILSCLYKRSEALTLRERALSAYVEQLDDHPFTGTLYNCLGNDCLALRNFDKAVEYFTKALSIRKMFLGFYPQETSRTLHDLGVAYKMKGEYVRAMGRLNRAIRIQETLLDEPYEKLLSLLEKREISSYLNLSETTTQELQMKIQECEGQIAQAKESNVRIERILEIANSRVYP